MGCDTDDNGTLVLFLFQSTHPHGVRPVSAASAYHWWVSIHAPTWGATRRRSFLVPTLRFNPRTHMGCDDECAFLGSVNGVSIHAPTWGATQPNFEVRFLIRFQSTHPHGVRPGLVGETITKLVFQSTHPHGVRQIELDNTPHCLVSIHAPTWGATSFSPAASICVCFNPRTHMGCDVPMLSQYADAEVSIHAPTWGATYVPHNTAPNFSFQSTHPHGVRRN